ncbi:GAF domain-containing protein [Consotaella aegiceratis]|uniref:GAF domain-containing protein n=1 Tax=Consotaella aegiceratis TaxID=3097961 RepID=UPI002F3F795E
MDATKMAEALAVSAPQPETALDALCALAQATVGAPLFTVMTFDEGTGMARRIYSNMPEAYPVSGTKPANPTDWSRQVLGERRTFVANDYEGIAAVFFDHELIRSLGFESVINVPVVVAGKVVGTLNCLAEAGHYTPERVTAAETLKLPGAACLLLIQTLEDRAS